MSNVTSVALYISFPVAGIVTTGWMLAAVAWGVSLATDTLSSIWLMSLSSNCKLLKASIGCPSVEVSVDKENHSIQT